MKTNSILIGIFIFLFALFSLNDGDTQEVDPWESGCPPKMAPANGFCIDINRHPGEATFEKASQKCSSLGYYLCSPDQWSEACANQAELNNMLDGSPEWVSSGYAMNNSQDCYSADRGVGSYSNQFFRCCR